MSKGEYWAPSKIDDSFMKSYLSDEENKAEPKHCDPCLTLRLVESKPKDMKKIKFSIWGRFYKKTPIKIVINEIVSKSSKKYITETAPTTTNIDK